MVVSNSSGGLFSGAMLVLGRVYLSTDTYLYHDTPWKQSHRSHPAVSDPASIVGANQSIQVRRGPGTLGALAKSLEVPWIDL